MVALSDLGRGGGRLKAGGMLDVKLHISSSIKTPINIALFLFIDRFGVRAMLKHSAILQYNRILLLRLFFPPF